VNSNFWAEVSYGESGRRGRNPNEYCTYCTVHYRRGAGNKGTFFEEAFMELLFLYITPINF